MKSTLHELARATPKLSELSEDYAWCVDRRGGSILTRQKENHDARYNIWPGQSSDGRKWTPRNGQKEVLPFPGASDCRVGLVDTLVSEDVARLMVIWRRNRILCTPTETNDTALANRLTHLLRWLFYSQMTEAAREAELGANWLLERGQLVLCAWWQRQLQMGYETLDMETLVNRAQMAQQWADAGVQPPDMPVQTMFDAIAAPEAVLDPAREDEAVQLFLRYYDDVKPAHAKRAVKDLRETGFARFPRPYAKRNRPVVGARAFHEEVFISPESQDFDDDCRSVHERELLSEAALRGRVRSHAWDPEWVDEVVEKQRGNVDRRFLNGAQRRWATATTGVSALQTEKLYEIIHSVRRVADDDGVEALEYTVWHKDMTKRSTRRKREESFAYHGVLDYDHGDLPYTLVTRERRSRVIEDQRGYGEIAATWQALIKGELDQRTDASSLKTFPPYHYPNGQPPSAWGPGVGIETNRPGDYGFFDGPTYNQGSLEIQETVSAIAERRFGRPLADGRNATGAAALQQNLADIWMAGWGRVGRQCLQLEQQFGPDTIYFRVIGTDKARPLVTTREEIQGQFDVAVSFNVQMLDPEYVKLFFEMTDKAMSWDVSGRVDRDEMVQIAFELWDPNLAERVMKPGEQAAEQEIADEQAVLTKLASGVPVDVKPGQAYQMRLQYLQQTVANSKKLQQQYAEDEDFRDLLDNHVKQLEHQIEQQGVNKDYGRLGGRPSYAGAEE